MKRKTLLYVLLGASIVVLWWYYHQRCPECQKRWARIKNRLGSRMIEPRPATGTGGAGVAFS